MGTGPKETLWAGKMRLWVPKVTRISNSLSTMMMMMHGNSYLSLRTEGTAQPKPQAHAREHLSQLVLLTY